MATIVTRAGKGSPLTNTEVDDNFTNLNTDKLEKSGGTMTGDLSFGDNDKAIFGAGGDLEIYSNGDSGIIWDKSSTGDLILRGSTLYLQTQAGENGIVINADADVKLYYDSAIKLATTSTGIDVTGTVTADGLTVDGAIVRLNQSSVSNNLIRFTENSVINNHIGTDGSGNVKITGNSFTNDNIAKFSSNGDISFYEHTGTTPKFFWDASAESLGIGTTTTIGTANDRVLVVYGDGNSATLYLQDSNSGTGSTNGFSLSSSLLDAFINNRENGNMRFYNNGSERMRIDSSGNVGIGTTNPEFLADIIGNAGTSTISGTTVNKGVRIRPLSSGGLLEVNEEGGDIYLHSGFNGGSMIFSTRNASTNSERMRIDSSGNVGIGTSNPTARLHVSASGLNTSLYPLDVISTWDRKGLRVKAGSNDAEIATFQDYAGNERVAIRNQGITFNGDTSTANTLNDYEEGTFTPSFIGGTMSVSYAEQLGRYTKVGNLVHITVTIFTTDVTITAGGVLNISGLPFTPLATGNQETIALSIGRMRRWTVNRTCNTVAAVAVNNNSSLQLYATPTANINETYLQTTDLKTGAYSYGNGIDIAGTYITA
jgi:hypothetical protein